MRVLPGLPIHTGSLLIVLACTAACPGGAAAQEAPSVGPGGNVGAAVSVRYGATRALSRTLPVVGFAGTLRLNEYWELGGEGLVAPRPIRVSPDDPADRSEITLGYGGIMVRYGRLPDAGRWGYRTALQVGAGTARVRSPLARTDVASSNFFLLEPQFELNAPRYRWLRPSVQLGYRFPFAVAPLPGVEGDQLRGPTLTFGITLVKSP